MSATTGTMVASHTGLEAVMSWVTCKCQRSEKGSTGHRADGGKKRICRVWLDPFPVAAVEALHHPIEHYAIAIVCIEQSMSVSQEFSQQLGWRTALMAQEETQILSVRVLFQSDVGWVWSRSSVRAETSASCARRALMTCRLAPCHAANVAACSPSILWR